MPLEPSSLILGRFCGVRDNTGVELLRLATKFKSPDEEPLVPEVYMPPGWDLDTILYSDGGAVLGVVETLDPLSLLPRLLDVSSIGKLSYAEVESFDSYDSCREPIEVPAGFAPADFFVRPEEWYGRGDQSPQPTNTWDVYFNPSSYPREIRNELITLLPKPQQGTAQATWEKYMKLRQRKVVSDSDFLDAMEAASSSAAQGSAIPGVPEALALREIVRKAVVADLEIFRGTSTLDDTPDRLTVKALERLGKMMVYLRWPLLNNQLEMARRCRETQLAAAKRAPA